MGLPPLFDEPQSQNNTPTLPPLFDEPQSTSNGEITNPTPKSWNVFPMTTGMFKNAPNIPVAGFAPLTGIADVARGLGIFGKTLIQHPLADKSMDFGTRLRNNLNSTQSLGSEVATNYLPPMEEQAQEALQRGEDPEAIARKLKYQQAGLSTAIDSGIFFGTGGRQGVEALVKGGANLVKGGANALNKVRGLDIFNRDKELVSLAEKLTPKEQPSVLGDVPYGPVRDQGQQELTFPPNEVKPTLAEDIKTVLTGLNTKGSTSGGRFTPESKIAAQRIIKEHIPVVLADVKATGRTVEESVKALYPDLSPRDTALFVKNLSKVGNLRGELMSPQLKEVATENPEVGVREVVTDKSVKRALTRPGTKEAYEFLTDKDPAELAAASRYAKNLAQTSMDLWKSDPVNAAQHKDDVLHYLRQSSKLTHIPGLMLRHAGDYKISPSFIADITARLKAGEFTANEVPEIKELIRLSNKLHPTLLKKVNDGVQEYGINMMLYNTDTAMRNTLGGAIGVLTNPIDRVGAAATTSIGRMTGLRDADMKNPTEWQEIGPSIGAGIKAIPGAVKRGVKYFAHESPEGLTKSYAKKAKDVRKQVQEGALTRQQGLTKIRSLKKSNKEIGRSFLSTEDESSLGFDTTRKLKSKNPILDGVGRVINYGVGAVKSMDVAQSHILKEMETTAAIVRKEVQNVRAGKRGPAQLDVRDKERIYKSVLHYTMRQALPDKLQIGNDLINSNAITGLTLPFMRAMIALPRFAAQRSLFALPGAAKNIAKTMMGKEELDVDKISRAALGTTIAVAGWYALKSKGIEIHSATTDPQEIKTRKLEGTPTGVYFKFPDGTTKRADDLAPVSYYFAAYAALDDRHRAIAEGSDTGDATAKAGASFGQNILSGSVFGGIRDGIAAITQGLKEAGEGSRKVYPGKEEGEKLDRSSWDRWWQRKVVSLSTPRLGTELQYKGVLQSEDKTYRNPRTLGEEYKTAVGFGLQESVPEQLDVFGSPFKRPEAQGPLDTAFGIGNKPKENPAIEILTRVGWYPSDVPKTIDGIRVSSEKRRQVLLDAGPEIEQELTSLSQDESFTSAPIAEQREEVKKRVAEIMAPYMSDLRMNMEDQVDVMPSEDKDVLRYNLRKKDVGILNKWGLDN